jgi:hypothetical protein
MTPAMILSILSAKYQRAGAADDQGVFRSPCSIRERVIRARMARRRRRA